MLYADEATDNLIKMTSRVLVILKTICRDMLVFWKVLVVLLTPIICLALFSVRTQVRNSDLK